MLSYGLDIISLCWTARHLYGSEAGVCMLAVEAEDRLKRGSSWRWKMKIWWGRPELELWPPKTPS